MTTTQPPACGKISEELKPCPFCGGTDIRLSDDRISGFVLRWYYCDDCDARTGTAREGVDELAIADVRERWNLRHPAPVADERAEVALLAANVVLREFVTSVQRSGATEQQLQGGARHALNTVEKIERAALSAQPSGALEREHKVGPVHVNESGGIFRSTRDVMFAPLSLSPPPERAPGWDAWLAIESAPKDGTWILLRGRNSADRPMIPVVAAWHPPGAMGRFGWVDSGTFKDVNQLAVDWMPLPDYYITPPPSSSPSATADATLRAALEIIRPHVDLGQARLNGSYCVAKIDEHTFCGRGRNWPGHRSDAKEWPEHEFVDGSALVAALAGNEGEK